MKLTLIALQLACLIGCASKNNANKKPGRYLYFTSNFPASVHWEIMTTFGNKSVDLLCKDFSMGSGQLEHSTKYVLDTLKIPNDTLKVPLFWTKKNLCGWEMSGISIGVSGHHIRMHQIYLKEKDQKHDRSPQPIPDSLVYICKYDSREEELNCNAENEMEGADFTLDDTLAINHMRIDLKGF